MVHDPEVNFVRSSHPTLWTFDEGHMAMANEAVALAEELTSNHFKYSTSQWRRSRYDIRTLRDLEEPEITDKAFAQILRYIGQPSDSDLGSARFDFYKVCLQDHVILQGLNRDPELAFFPLMIYVVTHELVHIVRFSRFLQSFEAYPSVRSKEEARVHAITDEILKDAHEPGLERISGFYRDSLAVIGVPLDHVGDAH
jgi:hypothetical protein